MNCILINRRGRRAECMGSGNKSAQTAELGNDTRSSSPSRGCFPWASPKSLVVLDSFVLHSYHESNLESWILT